jgi:hypothetical protein
MEQRAHNYFGEVKQIIQSKSTKRLTNDNNTADTRVTPITSRDNSPWETLRDQAMRRHSVSPSAIASWQTRTRWSAAMATLNSLAATVTKGSRPMNALSLNGATPERVVVGDESPDPDQLQLLLVIVDVVPLVRVHEREVEAALVALYIWRNYRHHLTKGERACAPTNAEGREITSARS